MRTDDLHAERVLQFHGAARVIDMAMGDPDGCCSYGIVLQRGENAVDIAARIDDDADLLILIEQDGAILLKRRDGDDAGIDLTHDDPFLVGRKTAENLAPDVGSGRGGVHRNRRRWLAVAGDVE